YDLILSNASGTATSSIAVLNPMQIAVWGAGTNAVAGLTNLMAVAGPDYVLRTNGAVFYWTSYGVSPVAYPSGPSNFVAIAGSISGSSALGITTNGAVYQLSSPGARAVSGLASNVVAVAEYNYDNFALLTNGTVTDGSGVYGIVPS